MIDAKTIHAQLNRIGFKTYGWGRTEVKELPHIMLPDEEIYECVNGIYEGGFALLIATNLRVVLIDKKPLNYLTVEDLRYDLISEIDYNHRLLGAFISISSGEKNLRFRSYNQPRLRKLISHVQHCMAEVKKKQSDHQEDQTQHLEQINRQLQAYLVAQHEQQQQLYEQLNRVQAVQQTGVASPLPPLQLAEPLRPSAELADYLYAQRLLEQHRQQTDQTAAVPPPAAPAVVAAPAPQTVAEEQGSELYAESMKEIYGKRDQRLAASAIASSGVHRAAI